MKCKQSWQCSISVFIPHMPYHMCTGNIHWENENLSVICGFDHLILTSYPATAHSFFTPLQKIKNIFAKNVGYVKSKHKNLCFTSNPCSQVSQLSDSNSVFSDLPSKPTRHTHDMFTHEVDCSKCRKAIVLQLSWPLNKDDQLSKICIAHSFEFLKHKQG